MMWLPLTKLFSAMSPRSSKATTSCHCVWRIVSPSFVIADWLVETRSITSLLPSANRLLERSDPTKPINVTELVFICGCCGCKITALWKG